MDLLDNALRHHWKGERLFLKDDLLKSAMEYWESLQAFYPSCRVSCPTWSLVSSRCSSSAAMMQSLARGQRSQLGGPCGAGVRAGGMKKGAPGAPTTACTTTPCHDPRPIQRGALGIPWVAGPERRLTSAPSHRGCTGTTPAWSCCTGV